MTPEEQNIKNKIDSLSDFDVFFNDSNLWERVEERLEKEKSRKNIFVWYWVAASLVLVGLSFYFVISPTTTPQSAIAATKPAAISTTTLTPEAIIQPQNQAPKIYLNKKKIARPVKNQDSTEDITLNARLFDAEVPALTSIYKPSFALNPKDLLQYPIAYKAHRVATLSLPLIPDEMMARESFAKRALRQIKTFNTEGKIDLRELNIEPRNVWAYLERSFFHDTTGITKLKPLKK